MGVGTGQGARHRDAEDCASDKMMLKKTKAKQIIRPASCLFKAICGQKINGEFSSWNLKKERKSLSWFRSHSALAELEEQLGAVPGGRGGPGAAGTDGRMGLDAAGAPGLAAPGLRRTRPHPSWL